MKDDFSKADVNQAMDYMSSLAGRYNLETDRK